MGLGNGEKNVLLDSRCDSERRQATTRGRVKRHQCKEGEQEQADGNDGDDGSQRLLGLVLQRGLHLLLHVSRVWRADEEGQEGEVVAERKGGHAHGGEQCGPGERLQHGEAEGDVEGREAVGQQENEGDEEGEDAERGNGNEGSRLNREANSYFMSFMNTRSMQMSVHVIWRKSLVVLRLGKMEDSQGRLSMKSTMVIYASAGNRETTSVLTWTPQMAIKYSTKNK